MICSPVTSVEPFGEHRFHEYAQSNQCFDKVYACTAGSVEAGTTMVTNHRQETFCQRVVASAIAHQDRVAMTLIEPQGKENDDVWLNAGADSQYRLSPESRGRGFW